MELCQKIVQARKQKGLTQEQLADLSQVTVRTIQRIESGETTPRAFTLKAIASVLEINFEELLANKDDHNLNDSADLPATPNFESSKHFLKMICLSCFSYLALPFIHVLVPMYLLKKSNEQHPAVIAFAKKIIRTQLYWKVALGLLLLATLAYNLIMAAYFQKAYLLSYLVPFFVLYFSNAAIIILQLLCINKMDTASKLSS